MCRIVAREGSRGHQGAPPPVPGVPQGFSRASTDGPRPVLGRKLGAAVSDIDPTETEAPLAAPAATYTRYFRDPRERVVGGVAAGLAAATGIDVAVIRLAFVVTALLHGAGVLAYLAAWVAMPELDEARTVREAAGRPLRQIAGAALAAIAVVVLVQPFAGELTSLPVLLPVLLIGVGIALWRPGRAGPPRPVTPPPAPGGPPVDPPTPGSPAGPPAGRWTWGWRREPGSLLGRVTVGVALLVLGLALVLDRIGSLRVMPGRAISLLLVVLGGGLLVGTLFGRARWLALPVALLIPPALAFGTLDRMGLDAFRAGDQTTIVARSAADIHPVYRYGTGYAQLDLGDADLGGGTKTVSVESGVGGINVVVPEGAAVAIDAETGIGPINLLDRTYPAGPGAHASFDVPGRVGAGRLRLHLRTGIGIISVERPFVNPPATPAPSGTPTGVG